MAEDVLEKLRATDWALLTELVRQDQGCPDLALLDWTVAPLGKAGFGDSEGQFRVHGRGQQGGDERTWSLIVKVQKQSETDEPLADYYYWKRELLAARSPWLARLPGPVRAQRIYRASEADGRAWLWMEHVHETAPQPWTLNEYAFAARQLGQWHGAYLAGAAQPAEPWLCRDHLRGWLAGRGPTDGWHDPDVSAHFSSTARARHQALWADLEGFLMALNHLPQVFSHFDYQRRNLFIGQTPNKQPEVVAIDWALCGLGPLGGDLFHLVGISAAFFDFEVEHIRELDAHAFAAYLDGLRRAGWAGPASQARLGYCLWAAGYSGATIPPIAKFFNTEAGRQLAQQSFGVSGAALIDKWSVLLDYCLDCADEARRLLAAL